MLTLKEMLDNVLLESGMDTESIYATSTEDSVRRLMRLANRSARRIATGHAWQALRRTYTFSLTTALEYVLPVDFRELISDTTFVDSYVHGVDMRTRPEQWRYLQVNVTGTGPRYRMRIMGNVIHVYQPQSGDEISFEYTSDYPVLDTDQETTQKLFDADTDTWRLDDDLLEMDIIWRYKKLLGLQDWQVDHAEFKTYDRTVKGQEAGAKTIYGVDGSEMPNTEPYTDLYI